MKIQNSKYAPYSGVLISVSEGKDFIHINIHIIICLHYKLCLLTEMRDPEKPKYILVCEVVIGVMEVPLHYVTVGLPLLPDLLLLALVLSIPQEKY